MPLIREWNLAVAPRRPRKPKPEAFGPRLERLRKARGLTQEELGDLVGLSNRMVAYYERDDADPPGPLLVDLARALRVSTDEMLGAKPLKEKASPKLARLLKKLQRVEELPAADQRAVLKFVDALVAAKRRTA